MGARPLLLSLLMLAACASAPGVSTKGKFTFDHVYHDFGAVMEGETVKHSFPFKNAGKGTLKVVKVETSCGCTTAEGALGEYAPGKGGKLDVVIDTRGKHGITVKTVQLTLENADHETVQVNLAVQLIPPPHPERTNGGLATKDAKCKTCHLEAGVGEKGIFLYHRICSQCHGSKGAGASAMALNDPKWLKSVKDDHLREVTEKGDIDAGMPPYVEGVTPPLTGEQLDSLVEYIRSLGKR